MSFPISPHGEKWEKKYMEREGKVFISLSFHILFPMVKNGKRHIFPMGKTGVGPPPHIYTFWSYDSHRDRAIKYLNFETNVNVHSSLTPVLPLMSACVRFFLSSSFQSCRRLLWMAPILSRLHKIFFKLR